MRFGKDDEITVATTAPEASGAPTRTVEQWGLAKGYLPEFFVPPDRQIPAGVQGAAPYGTVAVDMRAFVGPRHNTKYGFFAAAKVVGHWPEGKEMTEAEFDAAIKAAGEHLAR